MTPEELERLVVDGEPTEIADALAGLTERERRGVSEAGARLLQRARKEQFPEVARSIWRLGSRPGDQSLRQLGNAGLVVLGVGPLSRARRVEFLPHGEGADPVVKVLADRRPPWSSEWLEYRLEQDWPGLAWSTVRTLVTTGVCDKPKGSGYPRLMARELPRRRLDADERPVPLSGRLLADPGLLEDEVWRLFECETDAFAPDWISQSGSAPPGYETWREALVRLSREGSLDRRRLLRSSVAALWITTRAPVLSGFLEVHDGLEPTDEERRSHRAGYLELLSHKVPHVVGFALRQLNRLQKAGDLEAEAFFAAAGPVFALKPKAHPMAALSLSRRLLGKVDAVSPHPVALLTQAIRHPAGEVQESATGILERHWGKLEAGCRPSLMRAMPDVFPLVRGRLEALVGEVAVEPGSPAESAPADARFEESAVGGDDDLAGRAGRQLGLQEVDLTSWPPPFAPDGLAGQALDGLPRIAPIESVDELIDAVAHALEIVEAPEEIERIVAGIGRLCDARPPDFESRTAPLRKRMETAQREAHQGMAAWAAPLGLWDLVATWLAGARRETRLAWAVPCAGPQRFIDARMRELVAPVAAGQVRELLASPTHARGWIDPATLVERASRASQDSPLEADVVQALLRLAPVGREEARRTASSLQGPLASVLRYALGDGDHVDDGLGLPSSWWVAAARSRWPRADLRDRLAAVGGIPDWPEVLRPAGLTWTTGTKRTGRFGVARQEVVLEVETTPQVHDEQLDEEARGVLSRTLTGVTSGLGRLLKGVSTRVEAGRLRLGVAFPTSLPYEPLPRLWGEWGLTSWLIDWQALTWPANADGLLIRGARKMVRRIDAGGSTFEPHHVYLNPLFDRWRVWTEPAVLALSVALASRDADVRRLAVDALIQGIRDGRANPDALGRTLARMSEGGWLKPNRVSEALGEAARVSPLHQLAVARTLDRLFVELDSLPRSPHSLLRLLSDCVVALDASPSPELRARLRDVVAGGQTGRLSHLLAERGATVPGPGEQAVLRAAWAARLRSAHL